MMFCTADSAHVQSQPASGAPSGVFCVYSLLLSFKPRLQSLQTVFYHVSLRTPHPPPPIRKLLLFLSSLSFDCLLFIYIFISVPLLFLLRSAGTVWALLGTRRWSHRINNAECFYGNCLATVLRCECLLRGRADRQQDGTQTGRGAENKLNTPSHSMFFFFNQFQCGKQKGWCFAF